MSSKFLDKSYLIKYSNYFKVENRVFSFRNKELFDVTNTPMLLELKNNNGSKGYWKAIGIRVDEIDRMNENRVKKKILYPLVKEFPTKKIEILNNRRIR